MTLYESLIMTLTAIQSIIDLLIVLQSRTCAFVSWRLLSKTPSKNCVETKGVASVYSKTQRRRAKCLRARLWSTELLLCAVLG